MTKSIASSPVVKVTDLSKSFGNKIAVDKISLEINKGAIFGFLGPNGSGKTTTIRMLCGLLIPTGGSGTCLGYDIIQETQKIKPQIGYMTQHFSLYEDMTVRENLMFTAQLYSLDSPKQKVEDAIDKLGIPLERSKQLAGELSGGWKQRLALAAAIIHDPKLLLLDEPTAGVDPRARREFWDQIERLSREGVTTLVSTHYMDEAQRCHRLAYMENSKLILTGSASEIFEAMDFSLTSESKMDPGS